VTTGVRAVDAEAPLLTGVRAEGTLERALATDFARPIAFLLLAVAYVGSRLPFIDIGYGTDPDAWRVALSGHWLWDHGEFYPSRLPGYPVHELASAAVIKGGWLATNSLTLAVSLLGVWFFAAIASRLELPQRGLVVAGYAFTPLLYINSTTTMDYMWALTFILGAYYFLIRQSAFAAAVMMGLAIGARSTSLLFLLPFAVYLWRDRRRDEIRLFAVVAVAVALVTWSPIYWTYGARFINFYDADVGYLNVARLLAKDCLGLTGAFAALAAAAVSLPRLARLPGDAWRDKHVTLWALAIGVTVVSFLRLPHEAAYLIPLYPFAFMVMARYFQPVALAGAVAVIVAAGFLDLTSPGDDIGVSELLDARPGQGLVLSNRETMLEQLDFTRELERVDVPGHTVVYLGFVYPQFAVRNRERLDLGILSEDRGSISQLSDKGKAVDLTRDVVYVWLLDFDDFDRYQREGYAFMYTQDAGRSAAGLYDYRPGFYMAATQGLDACPPCPWVIDLGRGPTGGRGSARTDR
jgi:hypothetical protein